MEQYDRFFYNGHISIWKNCEKMNRLFEFDDGAYPALDSKFVFQSPESWYFDEQRGMLSRCIKNEIRVFDPTDKHGIMRDPATTERKFIWNGEQYVVLWQDGHLYSVNNEMEKQELLYAHFFRRRFNVEPAPEGVKMIKCIPGKVFYNEDICAADFLAAENMGYKIKYYFSISRNSFGRYGIIETLRRQKWSKDSDIWLKELREKEK